MTDTRWNARLEQLSQLLAAGKPAAEASRMAGYGGKASSAHRRARQPNVRARVAEIQAEVAKAHEITCDSLVADLKRQRDLAEAAGHHHAAVRAVEILAKISGALVERVDARSMILSVDPDTLSEPARRARLAALREEMQKIAPSMQLGDLEFGRRVAFALASAAVGVEIDGEAGAMPDDEFIH